MSHRPDTAGAGVRRILLTAADKFPPFRVDVAQLCGRELPRRGLRVDCHMQSGAPGTGDQVHRWEGGTAYVGAARRGESLLARLYRRLQGIRHGLRLPRLVADGHYDLLLVKDQYLAPLLVFRTARRLGVPVVYWLSYPEPEARLALAQSRARRYWILDWLYGHVTKAALYRLILARAVHVLAQSDQMRRDLVSMGVDGERITVVPMGVAPEVLAVSPPKRVQRQDRQRVVYLGTLNRARRLDFLVRCFARVLAQCPEAQLELVGGGEHAQEEALIRQEAERLGIGQRVHITGFLPRTEALERTAAAAVCVSPFYPTPVLRSTSPTKLIEYMALGRPSVANDHPEQSTLIAASGGGLCVPWEEAAFADAIVTLLTDRQRAEAMGRAARNYISEQRSYSRIADGVAECLARHIDAHTSAHMPTDSNDARQAVR